MVILFCSGAIVYFSQLLQIMFLNINVFKIWAFRIRYNYEIIDLLQNMSTRLNCMNIAQFW